MARTAIKASELPRVVSMKEEKARRNGARQSSAERIAAIGNKKFDSMTRTEKDELLFLLCLEHGILPKETE